MSYERLGINDLVYLECQIRRYAVRGDSQSWERFKTTFKLDAIVRLTEASEEATIESESEDESAVRIDTDDEFEGF